MYDQNYYYWMENVSLVSQVEESLIKHLIQFQFVMMFGPHFDFLNSTQELHKGCCSDSSSKDVAGGSRIGIPFLNDRNVILCWLHPSSPL